MTSRQFAVTVVGLTHASSVIPVVKCKDAASGMVTLAFVPLNDKAPPYLPAAVRVALTIVPVRPLPDASVTVDPVVSFNAYATTSSGTLDAVVTVATFE